MGRSPSRWRFMGGNMHDAYLTGDRVEFSARVPQERGKPNPRRTIEVCQSCGHAAHFLYSTVPECFFFEGFPEMPTKLSQIENFVGSSRDPRERTKHPTPTARKGERGVMERTRLREELLEVLRHLERQLAWQEASCSPGMTRRGRASRERSSREAEHAQGAPAQQLEALSAQIGACTRCPLHHHRTKIVFGSGNPEARIMFIGEAPGYEEDRQGVPFVGRSGRLLRRMLTTLSFPLDEIYIANIVKCRPPGNRDPEEGEIAACLPFLERQIEIVA
ncbi:MAG: uracil-DNA glycosylase, partial [Deltaproteobacteria bacterium]